MSGYFNFKEMKESILEDLGEYVRTKNKLNSMWNNIESYMIPLYEKVCERLPRNNYDSYYNVWAANGLFVDVTTTSDHEFEYTNFIQINIKLDLTSSRLVFTSRYCSNPSECRTATRNTLYELIVDYDSCNNWTGFHEECVAMVGATVADYIKAN